jgi:4-cresol dehydrogenase (hydroxylating)
LVERVNYFDLYRHIQERRLKVWIDCPDPVGAVSLAMPSIAAAATAPITAIISTPIAAWKWCCHPASCCGHGCNPKSETWQQYKTGCGRVDGIFSQSILES